MMGISDVEDRMILAGFVQAQYQRVTDGQTDRQTDGRYYHGNTALYRAVKVCKTTCRAIVT